MEYIWSAEIDAILSVGRTLDDVGVRNWALGREDALAALEQLSAIKVAVLGGDVYAIRGADVGSNYDNWHCDRDSGEADVDFIERSIAKAKTYIANYPANAGSVLVTIVPDIDRSTVNPLDYLRSLGTGFVGQLD